MNSPAAVVFLGVIAAAVLVMALVQVGAIVYAARMARRLDAVVTRLERDVQPAIERLTAMTGEAARAASVAAAQVDRVDRLVDDLSRRAERTVTKLQRAVDAPQREATALVAAVRAAVGALRAGRRARRRGSQFDEDDALFIG